MPLHTKLPKSRALVELLALLVVLALLLAGVRGMVLVCPLITSAVPCLSSEYVVPEIVTDSPGLSVVPGASTYSVVPSRTFGVYVLPLMVKAAAVTGPLPIVDVTPLMTTTEPDADAGMLNVVPEMVRTPPGVRV
jgi:hypothetical protein